MVSMDEEAAGRAPWLDEAHDAADMVADLEARHGQALFGFVRRLGLTDQQAEDCVQESLTRLWAELQRGTIVVDPKGWAYRAAYRLAMDEHRLRRRVAALVARIGERTVTASAAGRPDGSSRGLAGSGSVAAATTPGAVPAIPGRPPIRPDRLDPRHHRQRGAKPRHAGDAHPAITTGGATRQWTRPMNDDRIERALGAGPPDEAAYRVRGSAFWRAATPTDPASSRHRTPGDGVDQAPRDAGARLDRAARGGPAASGDERARSAAAR